MNSEARKIRRDDVLGLEAFHFAGMSKPFPNHFHEHYVIGLIESGARLLTCNGKEYLTGEGSLLLFNPNDCHGCTQADGAYMDYRGMNIPPETMLALAGEITGKDRFDGFSENVTESDEISSCFRALHQMVMTSSGEFEREEALLLLISLLIEECGNPSPPSADEYDEEIEAARRYMDAHFDEHITLDMLCGLCGLSKSTLLRAFTRSRKVTPYRYLQAVRICRARVLLEKGVPPAEAAVLTGFSDQSHFTNFFNMFTGVSPSAYSRIFKGGRDEK